MSGDSDFLGGQLFLWFKGRDNVGSLPFEFLESSHSFLRPVAVSVVRLFY